MNITATAPITMRQNLATPPTLEAMVVAHNPSRPGLSPTDAPSLGRAIRSSQPQAPTENSGAATADIQRSRFAGLENLNTDRFALLATQPMLNGVMVAELKRAFPQLPLPIDPDDIHIEVFTAAFDAQGEHRQQVSSETLPELLQKRLAGGQIPTFDASLGRAYLNQGIDSAGGLVREPLDLISLERFVNAFCNEMPALYHSQLKAFWAAPRENAHASNRLWLGTSLGAQWLAQAELRVADQTLPEASKTLLQRALGQAAPGVAVGTATPGPSVRVASLTVADARLAGAFILDSGSGMPASVVLYTPQQGLESFDTPAAARDSVARRLLDPVQRQRLEQLMNRADRKRTAMIHQPQVSFAPIQGDWLQNLASSHLEKQSDDLHSASREALALGVGKDWNELAGILDQAADMAPLLDVTNELHQRNDLLVAINEPGWLKRASQEDRTRLRKLLTRAQDAHPFLPPVLSQLPSLNDFAATALNQRLAKDFPGENLNANTLEVELASTRDVPFFTDAGDSLPVYVGTHSWQQHSTARTLSLTELALENVRIDSDETMHATFMTASGKRRPLYASYLKKMIRSLDVAEGYRRLVEKALLADDAQALRQNWTQAMGAQMSLHALVAQLGGNDTSALSPTGLGWVNRLLVPPGSNATDLTARYLMLGGSVGSRTGASIGHGVMVISPPGSRRVVLYTPLAPDGQAFREFTDATRQIGELLKRPDWQQYFLQRVSDSSHARLQKALAGKQLPAVQSFKLPDDFRNALYDATLGAFIANADFHSNSTAQANRETAIAWGKQGAELALDALAELLPGRLALPLSLLRGFMAAADGASAVADGDQERAMESFLDTFLHSLDAGAATLGLGVPRRRPAPLTTTRTASGAGSHITFGAVSAAPVAPRNTLGQADLGGYAVSEPAGLIYQQRGIYQAPGGYEYLQLDGRFYRTDIKQGQRHIVRPGNWSQSFPVDRVDQQWVPRDRSEGLGGGGNQGKIKPPQNAPYPQQTVAAVLADIKPLLGTISITDRPFRNANGAVQYTYDGNRNRVRARRLEIAKELGLSLSDAPADRRFLDRLGTAVGSELGADGKIFGQCGEMAALAAVRLRDVAAQSGDFVYTIQLPDANHTVTLLSKTVYRAGSKIDWAREHLAGSVIVDLWQGALSPGRVSALVSPASVNSYTRATDTRAWVQSRVWPEHS